jgi:hypothetical protein
LLPESIRTKNKRKQKNTKENALCRIRTPDSGDRVAQWEKQPFLAFSPKFPRIITWELIKIETPDCHQIKALTFFFKMRPISMLSDS